MHLLDYDGSGQLRLKDHPRSNLPPYAILSHTWGANEVTFQDVQAGTGKSKEGYRKIEFCLKQARTDGLMYCWVDTCCINKSSTAELSEAINSMFRWYRNAAKCYVYLADVPQESFRSSRWFTRGWTLQELVVPGVVEFFSAEGLRLGDKKSLIHDIHERTQIPIVALRQDQELGNFSVKEKMSWVAHRKTTVEEDMAYCLLGIFQVFMSPIYGEGRENAEHRLRKAIEEKSPSTVKYDFTLPFGLPGAPIITSFIGRDDELAKIRQALPLSTTREVAVLHGVGGMGKTQLAIEYAKRYQDDYTAVLWMDGKDETTLQQSFISAARRLNYAHPSLALFKSAVECSDVAESTHAVRRWLDITGNNRWLLIIDNVDDPHVPGIVNGLYDVRKYFSTTLHGHVLITTRSSLLRVGRQVRVRNTQSDRDCLKILRANSQREGIELEPASLKLIKRLDRVPLAIAIAGAYIGQDSDPVEVYLEQYESSWLELQQSSPGLPEHEGRTMLTTWEMSRLRVQKSCPAACRLLELWACFANQDLWYELLEAGRDYKSPEWFLAITSSKIAFKKHMRLLYDYGLVKIQEKPAGYGTHSCVHDWLRELSSQKCRSADAELALRCISFAVPDRNEAEYWVIQQRLLNHTVNCIGRIETLELFKPNHVHHFNLGILYNNLGKLASAETMYKRALEGYERALGREHTSTLDTVSNFGFLYFEEGKLKEAEIMYKRALEGYEKALGREHPSTLRTVNNIGVLYVDQGRRAEAEVMYNRALEGYEKALGREHTSTLDTVNNLGILYADQGKLADAAVMYNRALNGKEKALGREHTLTLGTVNNLGLLYRQQGNLTEAEKLCTRALEGYEKAFGREHTSTMRTANNLANLYREQGKFEEAEALLTRAKDGYETRVAFD